MAWKTTATLPLFFLLNLLLFSLSGAWIDAPSPSPTRSPFRSCPFDTLKLGVCVNLLNDILYVRAGTPSKEPCCGLINGLHHQDATACLCTAAKANILGTRLSTQLSLPLLLKACGKKVPTNFQCAQV
ncbi:hypothetical protein SAY86_028850 [Trapa natans]|uniref:Bifunctional inhibitor/plant lipid transfer protein/seed storage helical domain-containing protein n=1 Tax=Trapa natans TaxID=22666 RepID=A0AAN7M1A3_TRANT|nr:hypothetical protein SAY86_028850 [Trapa natans]